MRIFILILVCSSLSLYAGKAINGYYIKYNGDSVHTKLEVFVSDNYSYLENGVVVKDSSGRSTFLNPSKIKEFGFYHKRTNRLNKFRVVRYRELVYSKNNHSEVFYVDKVGFYEVLVEGHISLLLNKVSKYSKSYFLTKGNNIFQYISAIFARDNLKEYLTECKVLDTLIKNDHVGDVSLANLLVLHNRACSSCTTTKDFSYPDFHQSSTKFKGQALKANYKVLPPLDVRVQFYKEKMRPDKNLFIKEHKYLWSEPVTDIVDHKLCGDLLKIEAIDTNAKTFYILPTIEVFFSKNTGILLNSKTNTKIRIKITLMDESKKEVLCKTYESLYSTSGADKEYEGSFLTTPEKPVNIAMGVCLRKTLDKFYLDLAILPN